MSRVALVRRPSPRLAEGIVTHIDRSPVDVALAERQWADYVAALQAHGWHTVEVEPAPDLPDSVFVEDTVVVHRDLAVITRPGAPERRDETVGTEAALRALGYRIDRITAPGTLDGGDVMQVGDTVYVGRGGRTNMAGIAQLEALLAPRGAAVITVPVSAALHLKSTVTALPDHTIIGWERAVDDVSLFPRFLSMPEESGAHVVLLGDDHVLMAAGCPRSEVYFRSMGLHPVVVDISEFVKLEGCVTCLSVRLRHAPAG